MKGKQCETLYSLYIICIVLGWVLQQGKEQHYKGHITSDSLGWVLQERSAKH